MRNIKALCDPAMHLLSEFSRLEAPDGALVGDKADWKEVNLILEEIGLNEGRLQDVRGGYTLVRDLYRGAWLLDNRPYWPQNDLVRCDRASDPENVTPENIRGKQC